MMPGNPIITSARGLFTKAVDERNNAYFITTVSRRADIPVFVLRTDDIQEVNRFEIAMLDIKPSGIVENAFLRQQSMPQMCYPAKHKHLAQSLRFIAGCCTRRESGLIHQPLIAISYKWRQNG